MNWALGPEPIEKVVTKAASVVRGQPLTTYGEMFQAMGHSPEESKILESAFRGTLQGWNAFAFPLAIAKTIGTAVGIGKTTANIVRATGVTEPIAQAAGTAGRLMAEGRYTGPVIRATTDLAMARVKKAAPLLNKYAGLPPDFRQSVEQYFGDIRTSLGTSAAGCSAPRSGGVADSATSNGAGSASWA